jgi:hypothetical protein
MSELIEKDVIGRCIRVSEVIPEGIQPPERTIYAYSTLDRWIWELSFLSPLSRAYKM